MKPLGAAAMVLGLALAVATAACGGGEPENGLNVVEEANLEETSALTILRRVVETTEEGRQEERIEVAGVVMGQQLEEVVAALDRRLAFEPATECESELILDFNVGGRSERLSYRCGEADRSLRGGQPYWQGMQVTAPSKFDKLIQEAIAER